MRSMLFSARVIPLAIACGLGLAGNAPAAGHETPLNSSPNRVYPSGADIRQVCEGPQAAAAALDGADAAPGAASPVAATHNLLQMPKNLARVRNSLTPVLRSETRVQLQPKDAPGGIAALAPGQAASLQKFTYGYVYKGVPLWKYSSQSQIALSRGASRTVLVNRERNAPDLDRFGATEPTVPTADATKVGLADAKGATGATLAVDTDNETPHAEFHVDARGKPTLAWAFVVRSGDRKTPFARRYWVAALEAPAILAKEDLIYHQAPAAPATQQGRVTGNFFALRQSPLNPPAKNQGLNDFTIVAGNHPVNTDAGGFFSVPGNPTKNTRLVGPYCTVINEAGPPLLGTVSGHSEAFNATSQEELAQVSAFHWVSTAHRFVADFVAGNDDRLRGLPTHVNIDDTCNAFFDPNSRTLNFFKAGNDCVNTAYCDVACHEFGHAVDDQFGGILDGGYSEAFGDSLAILITRDSKIGRDFMGSGTVLRDASIVSTWPPQDSEVHEVGKIYGGFTWELTRQLLTTLKNDDQAFEAARHLVLGAAALNPKDTVDAVRLSFFVDHKNGSPYFKELAAAADSRKIPRPHDPSAIDDSNFLNGNGSDNPGR